MSNTTTPVNTPCITHGKAAHNKRGSIFPLAGHSERGRQGLINFRAYGAFFPHFIPSIWLVGADDPLIKSSAVELNPVSSIKSPQKELYRLSLLSFSCRKRGELIGSMAVGSAWLTVSRAQRAAEAQRGDNCHGLQWLSRAQRAEERRKCHGFRRGCDRPVDDQLGHEGGGGDWGRGPSW